MGNLGSAQVPPSTDIISGSACLAQCRRDLQNTLLASCSDSGAELFGVFLSLLSSQFPIPGIAESFSAPSCSTFPTFTPQSALAVGSSRFPHFFVFLLAMSHTYSGYFSLQPNDQLLLSCLFPCSHFHLIYSPTTKLLSNKITFLYHFIEHSSGMLCFFFSTDLLLNAAISFLLHVAPNNFWTCFKILSNLCFLLILPLLPFIFISLHHILSLSSGKKPDKMRCLCLPVGLTFFIHHKNPLLQKFLIYFVIYLFYLSHHVSFYVLPWFYL